MVPKRIPLNSGGSFWGALVSEKPLRVSTMDRRYDPPTRTRDSLGSPASLIIDEFVMFLFFHLLELGRSGLELARILGFAERANFR